MAGLCQGPYRITKKDSTKARGECQVKVQLNNNDTGTPRQDRGRSQGNRLCVVRMRTDIHEYRDIAICNAITNTHLAIYPIAQYDINSVISSYFDISLGSMAYLWVLDQSQSNLLHARCRGRGRLRLHPPPLHPPRSQRGRGRTARRRHLCSRLTTNCTP